MNWASQTNSNRLGYSCLNIEVGFTLYYFISPSIVSTWFIRTGTTYHSGAHESISIVCWICRFLHNVLYIIMSYLLVIVSPSSVDGFWLPRWCLEACLPMSDVVVCVVIVCFVNIAEIVDHYCLNFPFIA